MSSSPEIVAIWAIGQKLWKKDLPGTYEALAAYSWTEPVSNIIRALEGNKIYETLWITHTFIEISDFSL